MHDYTNFDIVNLAYTSNKEISGMDFYLGCYVDFDEMSILNNNTMSSLNMTNRQCIQWCYSLGYLYAGTYSGSEFVLSIYYRKKLISSESHWGLNNCSKLLRRKNCSIRSQATFFSREFRRKLNETKQLNTAFLFKISTRAQT